MAEQKDILGKLLNGKTTTAGVLGILVILGLNSLGIGGSSGRASSKEDVENVINPVVAKMYERSEQSERLKREIIENEKIILANQTILMEKVATVTTIQQGMMEELREMRRGRP
jgi:hypothetical protein